MLIKHIIVKSSVFLLVLLDSISTGPTYVLILVICLTRSETKKLRMKMLLHLISNTAISLVLNSNIFILMVSAPKIASIPMLVEQKPRNSIATSLVKMVNIFTGMEPVCQHVLSPSNTALMEVSKLAVILALQMITSTSMAPANLTVLIPSLEDSKVTENTVMNHALPTHTTSITLPVVQIVILLSNQTTPQLDGLVIFHVTQALCFIGIILVRIALFHSCLPNPMILVIVLTPVMMAHTFIGTPHAL